MKRALFLQNKFVGQTGSNISLPQYGHIGYTNMVFTKNMTLKSFDGASYDLITPENPIPENITYKDRNIKIGPDKFEWSYPFKEPSNMLDVFRKMDLVSPLLAVSYFNSNGLPPSFGLFLGFERGIFRLDFEEDYPLLTQVYGAKPLSGIGATFIPEEFKLINKQAGIECVLCVIEDGILVISGSDIVTISIPELTGNYFLLRWVKSADKNIWLEILQSS